ncbi:MAG: D-2-hydroxyacid dehydrogenase [Anaerolineae bacterium]
MKHNILVLTEEFEPYKELMAAHPWPGATISFAKDADEQSVSQADILFGSPAKIAPALEQATNLKWVQSTWAGVEPFVKPAMRTDYKLTNVKGIFGRLIAEYALTYILAHERHLHKHAADQQNKAWDTINTGYLKNKTIGIIGVGSIGTDIALLFKTLGLTVWGYTRSSENCDQVDLYFHSSKAGQADALLEMAAGVDYLITTMPHTPESENMLGKAVFKAMRPSALLLNIGRGTSIIDADLIDALESGEIAGAILDVFRQEPLPADHPFWTTKNLTITPHTSAPSFPEDVVPIFHRNYMHFVKGEPLEYVIDFAKGY